MTLGADGTDPLLDGTQSAIRSYMHAEHGVDVEPVVVEYVLVAGWLDGDGVWNLFCDSADGQRGTTSLGLLRAATMHEEQDLLDSWDDDE